MPAPRHDSHNHRQDGKGPAPGGSLQPLRLPNERAHVASGWLFELSPGSPIRGSAVGQPDLDALAWHPVGMPFPADLPAEITAGPWRLRLLADANWELAWVMSRDPDVVRWTLYPPEMTEDAAHRRSRRITESANQRLSGQYAVLDVDHRAIGTAGVASSDGDPAAAEVFYALLPQGRHRGAATAAALALSEWAFSVGVERVLLLTITGNTASEAVAVRAEFEPDGEEIRDHQGSPTRMQRWARTTRNRTA